MEALAALLRRALADDPLPALRRDGGFVRDGYDSALDAQRTLMARGNALLAELEQREAQESGISALKLRYNKIWGYYLELGKAHEGKVPGHFVHRQTTVGTHRYTTPALMDLERQLAGAGAAALQREEEIFALLVDEVKKVSTTLLSVAEALATLDVLASLANVAAKGGWVCPGVEESAALEIEGGKHPVVCGRVPDFVPNDCDLSGGKLWLLTGPNMAGKSTFLRQVALLALLAQMGSWVPAKRMRLGVMDAVFSRIGAADNLAAGQSTFMVEMVETAQILNRATARSLVILDELGRGTATYDGLALAWACVEDVVGRVRCRTLFATHYHELTALSDTLPAVQNHQLAVKPWRDDVVFLHTVIPGAAVGSYGISVAKLAGVPPAVVKRAQVLLDGFLHISKAHGVVKVDELSLFAQPVQPVAVESEIERRLRGVNVDDLSPRAAWDLVSELRKFL
jgi:DNA mismatch repair protein MutS